MWIPISILSAVLTFCQAVKIATEYLDEAAFGALVENNSPILAILRKYLSNTTACINKTGMLLSFP